MTQVTEDIPAFLKLSREERAQARAEFKPSDMSSEYPRVDTGPGSVARRLGYLESAADVQARIELLARSAAEAERKRLAGLRDLAAWKAERATEKAEMDAARKAARAQ